LSICQSILKRLSPNRKLEVESQLGKGSKFMFYLPNLSIEDEAPAANSALAHIIEKYYDKDIFTVNSVSSKTSSLFVPSAEENHSKDIIEKSSHVEEEENFMEDIKNSSIGPILIVDDNPFNLLVVKQLVQKHCPDIYTATNGEEAIRVVTQQSQLKMPIRFIFMDLQMPVMDGYEATIKLRKMMKNGEIPSAPVYAISANDTEADKQKCIEVGMEGHLSKPILEKDLVRILKRYFVL